MAQIRWILLGLGVLLIGGIWWWGARRSQQARGNAELRESASGTPAVHAHAAAAQASERYEQDPPRDWGVPPFEPLSIRTADFDDVQFLDLPMTATSEPLEAAPNVLDSVEHEPERPVAAAANASEAQRIVTVRVSAADDARWVGTGLMAALEAHGLGYGRYQVFHRMDSDGRTLFYAASLVEPGTFDLATMPEDEFRGLTLFAVLPGPADPLQTIDALLETAEQLALTLRGTVQDSTGVPLSAQRADALRADAARCQTLLPAS